MNIIEKNYVSKLSVRETQEALKLIDEIILYKLNDFIEFIFVRQPLISSKRTVANTLNKNRQINFDSSNDSNVYFFYNDYKYWLINTLKKLDVKNNNAIATIVNYIERDNEIKNTKSLERRKLILEYRYDNKEMSYEKALELNDFVYNSIKYCELEIFKKFRSLKENKLPEILSIKELKKITSNHNLNDSLSDVASLEGNFLLIDKRNPKTEKGTVNTFEISMHSHNKEINKSYKIYKIQDRRTIEDIEPFTSESDVVMEEYLFGKEELKNNNIRSINIEIDLDALSLLLLEKSHILEIQSGSSIEEIEKILKESEVEHI